MSLTLQGRIIQIGDKNQVSDKFAKREFVIEITDGAYNKNVAMQFTNDKCALLDKYQVNQNVTVSFNLDSREHNSKWYTNVTAWRIDAATVQQPVTTQSGTYDPSNPTNDLKDNLPF